MGEVDDKNNLDEWRPGGMTRYRYLQHLIKVIREEQGQASVNWLVDECIVRARNIANRNPRLGQPEL